MLFFKISAEYQAKQLEAVAQHYRRLWNSKVQFEAEEQLKLKEKKEQQTVSFVEFRIHKVNTIVAVSIFPLQDSSGNNPAYRHARCSLTDV